MQLGLGDIALPGLLVAFCRRFDSWKAVQVCVTSQSRSPVDSLSSLLLLLLLLWVEHGHKGTVTVTVTVTATVTVAVTSLSL